jgi:hypothetical protein
MTTTGMKKLTKQANANEQQIENADGRTNYNAKKLHMESDAGANICANGWYP